MSPAPSQITLAATTTLDPGKEAVSFAGWSWGQVKTMLALPWPWVLAELGTTLAAFALKSMLRFSFADVDPALAISSTESAILWRPVAECSGPVTAALPFSLSPAKGAFPGSLVPEVNASLVSMVPAMT